MPVLSFSTTPLPAYEPLTVVEVQPARSVGMPTGMVVCQLVMFFSAVAVSLDRPGNVSR